MKELEQGLIGIGIIAAAAVGFGFLIEYAKSVMGGDPLMFDYTKRKYIEHKISHENPPFKRWEKGQLYLDFEDKEYYKSLINRL